ncbi:MAG: 6-carboxytetrahydropterin synthase QueD [Elusimicrobia bacterium]|jgi:6-pyruvoyltetrahydropterin/6-carboxytetrahydropterin synthase|nr:6-carboxytetrahydropterin synthase QueD [Elusimicrobiota bacterium]
MYKITIKTHFSSAHHLRNYKGNCENVHGHNWKVEVTAVFSRLPDDGMVMDFKDLKKISSKVIGKLDHKDINKLNYFKSINPTSENIARYIFDGITKEGVPVGEVKVFETENYSASYTKDG